MKSFSFTLRNTLFFIFVFVFSYSSLATELIDPESTVSNFYKAYLNDDSVGNDALIKRYISDKLIKSISDSTMCNYDSDDSVSVADLEKRCSQKHECKKYKGNYICDWYGIWVESDINYFIKSQDVYPSWKSNVKTNIISQKGKESLIDVVLGGGTTPTKRLRVTLKQENDGWKIIKVTE